MAEISTAKAGMAESIFGQRNLGNAFNITSHIWQLSELELNLNSEINTTCRVCWWPWSVTLVSVYDFPFVKHGMRTLSPYIMKNTIRVLKAVRRIIM